MILSLVPAGLGIAGCVGPWVGEVASATEGDATESGDATTEATGETTSGTTGEMTTGTSETGETGESAGTTADTTESDGELPTLEIFGDVDRDGVLSEEDRGLAAAPWSWEAGALILANLDDDDGDGIRDADDAEINGAGDADDLARLRVVSGGIDPTASITLGFTGPEAELCAESLRIFVGDADGEGWTALDGPVDLVDGALDLAVEARRFAGPDWSGRCVLEAAGAGQVAATEVRVAPWLMLPNTAATEVIYVGTDAYPNFGFVADLKAVAGELAGLGRPITLVEHSTFLWRDMWMQDTMEIGFTEIPGPRGPQRLHIVLQANRGPSADEFPPTLLGPGVGVIEVGSDRGLSGGDAWADWHGNLEVSPPVPEFPFGRVYYGENTSTGVGFDPAIVDFIAAQGLQEPFAVDTSWLTIKHVDEILNFLPGPGDSTRMIVASPRAAASFRPLDAYNSGIQATIDATVEAALGALGLDPAVVIELPVAFRAGEFGALNLWSNPVNSVYLRGLVITGDADEATLGQPKPLSPALRGLIDGAFAKAAIDGVRFVDDAVYQVRWGNVHCATNTRRTPPIPGGFWSAI